MSWRLDEWELRDGIADHPFPTEMSYRAWWDEQYRRAQQRPPQSDPSALWQPSAERVAELAVMRYSDYLLTLEWAERRRDRLGHAEHKCQRCGSRDERLEVHHLTYERRGNEWPTDLEVLCRSCHAAEHQSAA